MNEEFDEPEVPPHGARYSFPMAVPLVVFPLLAFFGIPALGTLFGYFLNGIYFFMIAAFVREAFSSKEYEAIASKDQSLTLFTWRFNWLMFFVLWPIVLWGVLAAPQLSN